MTKFTLLASVPLTNLVEKKNFWSGFFLRGSLYRGVVVRGKLLAS